MSVNNTSNKIQPDSWLASLLGGLYFLLAGFILIQNEIPMEWSVPAWLRFSDWLFLFGLLAPAIGFAAGFALGFPRWSYPYTGGLLVFSLYMMNMTTPLVYDIYHNYDQGWGWRAWVPALLAALIGFLLSLSGGRNPKSKDHPERSTAYTAEKPSPASGRGAGVKAFFSNIRQDPTLATYAMFAWIPLIIFISFDEIARPYSLVFMLLLTGCMVATAILYQRARSRERRLLFLAGGLLLSLILTEIGMIAYWLPLQGVDIPRALFMGIVIAGVMLYPFWLAHLFTPAKEGNAPS